MKIKWKISPAPTGRFRSFAHRGWPMGDNEHGEPIASLSCSVSYDARRAADSGEHEIVVRIADWSNQNAGLKDKTAFEWRKLKRTFKNVKDAKAAASAALDAHPHFLPIRKDLQ